MIRRKKKEEEIIEEEVVETYESTSLVVMQNTDLIAFQTNYRKIMCIYEAAVELMRAKLQILNDEFQCNHDRNPIENVKSRIKSMESIAHKMEKKNLSYTIDSMIGKIFDIAGVRVVCPFISDVYYIADTLLKQSDIVLLEQKDYIANPKANGYRSLHLIVNIKVPFSDGIRQVPVEIQLRTIAMNCWASLEHQLRYKKDYAFSDEMQIELLQCAEQMAQTDAQMQRLASQLPEFSQFWQAHDAEVY